MVTINNSQISKNLVDGAKIQISTDSIPNQLSNVVIPTMEINPKILSNITIVRAASANGTVYTTPTNQDFYLCGIYLTGSNNVASQNSLIQLTITPKDEAAVIIHQINWRTSALIDVGQDSSYLDLSQTPIKLARGTNITLGSSNAATIKCSIMGFVDEQSLA